MPCACCITSSILTSIFFTGGAVYVGSQKLGSGKGWLSFIVRSIGRLVFGITLLIGCALGLLAHNDKIRAKLFAASMVMMMRDSGLDSTRCNDLGLRDIVGSIIEIGPGPGTNFRCWAGDDTNVSDWTGVEPNTYFTEAQETEAHALNLNFPRNTLWLGAGDHFQERVPLQSFDNAVFTHVLCSVEDPIAVLQNVAGALKDGGKIFLLEHVTAPSDQPKLRFAQNTFAPIMAVIGDGCKFLDTYNLIMELNNTAFSQSAAFSTSFQFERALRLDVSMALPLLNPHLIAVSTVHHHREV